MNLTRRLTLGLMLGLLIALSPSLHGDESNAKEETTESAIFLLRRSMQVSRDGRHNVLLRALRQLGDPALEPLFSELFQSENPTLKIHGILGLAECSGAKKLSLVRLASIENPAIQAEVVSAAMDSDILNDDQAKEVFNWPGLDAGVKVLVAAPLIKSKQLPNADILRESLKSDNLGRRGMAALLLLQLGEPKALEELQKVDQSDDPRRDTIREILLATALRYEFDHAAEWAAKVSVEPKVSTRLSMLALRTAMRLGAPAAAGVWRDQYQSDADPSRRLRLAIIALQLSQWVDPSIFDVLKKSDDSLICQIGAAGEAVAAKKPSAEAVVALVRMGHPLANNWAMGYARRFAPEADAEAILTAVINGAGEGLEKTRMQRLDDAVSATHLLAERSPAGAVKILRGILADPKTSPEQTQAILLGLISSKEGNPQQAVEGLPPSADPMTNNIALVLKAKNGVALSPGQLRDLSLVVRGGGVRQESLRIQAAWIYLKLTDQTKTALAAVLGKPE